MIEVVALAGTLTHTSKDRVTTVEFGDVVDQLLDEHGLTHASTSKEPSLTTLGEWRNEVDHLDTSLKDLGLVGLLSESRGLGMDGRTLRIIGYWLTIDWFTHHIKHPPLRCFAHRHTDWCTSRDHCLATLEAVGRLQTDGSHRLLVKVLCYLKRQRLAIALDVQGVVDSWQLHLAVELHIHHHTHDLDDFSLVFTHSFLLLLLVVETDSLVFAH